MCDEMENVSIIIINNLQFQSQHCTNASLIIVDYTSKWFNNLGRSITSISSMFNFLNLGNGFSSNVIDFNQANDSLMFVVYEYKSAKWKRFEHITDQFLFNVQVYTTIFQNYFILNSNKYQL